MIFNSADILVYVASAVLTALKQVPGVGMLIDYEERIDMAHKMREVFARFGDIDQRMAALETLATIPRAEVDTICKPRLHGSAEQQQYALEVLRQISQRITRKTTSTKRLGTPKLTDEVEFYLDLVPERRPYDYGGREVPHHPRWVLQELIGSGGMGEVWRACHKTLPEQEAIKFCHDAKLRNFLQREVDSLKRVQRLPQHPNIVRLKDVNLDHVPYWLAFEYIPGGTLLDLMQQRQLSWHETLTLMTRIGAGVAAAHALGIVHRDLKPANILLTADGIPKVTDFGLGKILEQTNTNTRAGLGTQDYASPEQVQGQSADTEDDIYALGVILWQLATHTLQSPHYLRYSLDHSRLPQAAKQLITECLERPRGQRPTNAAAFLHRLQYLALQVEPPAIMSAAADLELAQVRRFSTRGTITKKHTDIKRQEQRTLLWEQYGVTILWAVLGGIIGGVSAGAVIGSNFWPIWAVIGAAIGAERRGLD